MSEMTEKLLSVIREGTSFLVSTHVNPEGDAIGSEIAFALGLRKMGKMVYVYNQDPVPYYLRFLEGADLIHTEPPDTDFEVGVLLDCASPERTGTAGEAVDSCETLICIDHHITNGGYGDAYLIDPAASSTGELVFTVLERLGVEIDLPIGNALWVSIATDTGWFRYSNTTEKSLEIARTLLSLGVKPWVLSEELYGCDPPERYYLLSRLLHRMEVDDGVASMTVFKRDMEDFGATKDFLEGFINYPRSLKGVKVAVLYREEDGKVKVSLRARGDVNVDGFARSFGGGGHEKAAGFTLTGSVEEVKSLVHGKLKEFLKEYA
ncbi:MAG: bifunctional oligoribonuclease/PAP phosphatase NrnA [Deltaproteobacteria bacterium]|nr:MAG: bifunctional oligoribonuclease/PAP phosphatase NrnA [Deltaproteobacteria bacterium]